MTTTTTWSDVPPSEPGDYRLRYRGNESPENEFYATLEPTGHWRCAMAIYRGEWVVQFGPRVLTAEETVELTTEVERLRTDIQQVQELREKHEKPLLGITSPMGLIPDDDDFPSIPCEVVQKLKCVPAEELQQLRAAAAELAEIHRAWGMAAKDL